MIHIGPCSRHGPHDVKLKYFIGSVLNEKFVFSHNPRVSLIINICSYTRKKYKKLNFDSIHRDKSNKISLDYVFSFI